MIKYIKKLLSKQYFHKFENTIIYKKCLKCKEWEPYWFPELSFCKMSDNEFIIKNIIE